jgi:hypothetical protein
VNVRRVIAKERRDWALGKELLESRVELVQSEIENLRSKTEDARGSLTEAETKKADLVAERARSRAAFASLEDTITVFEERTAELLRRLPDPLRERVRPLSQQLPDDPAETKLSLVQRFQNVIGILDAVNKFQREVQVSSEVRALPDGTHAEVTAVYLGIGQAWYVTRKGDAAGIGSAAGEAWSWQPADEHATAIQRVIAILQGEAGAAFVRLPVQIH